MIKKFNNYDNYTLLMILNIIYYVFIYFSMSFLIFFLYIILRIYRRTIAIDSDLLNYASIFAAMSAIFWVLSCIIYKYN